MSNRHGNGYAGRFAGGFVPAQKSELLQRLDGSFRQNVLDPVDIYRMDDKTGRGNYALQNQVPEVVPAVGADRFVGTFDNDYVDTPIVLGNDFDVTLFDISFRNFNVDDFIFSQYKGGDPMRMRLDVKTSGILTLQTGGQIRSFSEFVFSINMVYRSVRLVKIGSNADLYVNDVLVSSKVGLLGVTQNETFQIGDEVQVSDSFYLGGIKVDNETFIFDTGSGSTITGSLGTIATISDGLPNTFWDNGIVNKINVNPNPTTTDGLVLDARLFQGYQTREELEALQVTNLTYITKNDGLKFLCYNYINGTVLLAPQDEKMIRRVRRNPMIAIDSNSDLAIDSNLDDAIAL